MVDITNIAICDDERVQLELLNTYVKRWSSKNNIKVKIDLFYSAESFEFKWSENKTYQILLLDIEMPGQNGVELSRNIRKEDSIINIIFITAISDYIGVGYDVDALNYLIKPIREEKLYECLDKAMLKSSVEEKWILIEDDGDMVRIKERDIYYIESFSHLIQVNTLDIKYSTRKNIGIIENELDENIFIRCHRSYLVSILHIKTISKDKIELDNGYTIPISRRRYKEVNMKFIEYFRGD